MHGGCEALWCVDDGNAYRNWGLCGVLDACGIVQYPSRTPEGKCTCGGPSVRVQGRDMCRCDICFVLCSYTKSNGQLDSRLQLFSATGAKVQGDTKFVLARSPAKFAIFVKELLKAHEKPAGILVGYRVWRFDDNDKPLDPAAASCSHNTHTPVHHNEMVPSTSPTIQHLMCLLRQTVYASATR
jgi:hypothetical protein